MKTPNNFKSCIYYLFGKNREYLKRNTYFLGCTENSPSIAHHVYYEFTTIPVISVNKHIFYIRFIMKTILSVGDIVGGIIFIRVKIYYKYNLMI
jgi:hypothetical protein